MIFSNLSLYLCSTPAVYSLLTRWATQPDLPVAALSEAQAIVICAADLGSDGSGSLGPLTIERLIEAARLYRALNLPILVSGGSGQGLTTPLANMMQQELEVDFGVPVRWVENKSRTTYENAEFSSVLLKLDGISIIIIVAQPMDIPRLTWSFTNFGLKVAPHTSQFVNHDLKLRDFLPSTKALQDSYYIFHEIIGLFFYKSYYASRAQ